MQMNIKIIKLVYWSYKWYFFSFLWNAMHSACVLKFYSGRWFYKLNIKKVRFSKLHTNSAKIYHFNWKLILVEKFKSGDNKGFTFVHVTVAVL